MLAAKPPQPTKKLRLKDRCVKRILIGGSYVGDNRAKETVGLGSDLMGRAIVDT